MYSIQKISAQDTYSVRHPVLRKGNSFEIENIGEHVVMFKKLI